MIEPRDYWTEEDGRWVRKSNWKYVYHPEGVELFDDLGQRRMTIGKVPALGPHGYDPTAFNSIVYRTHAEEMSQIYGDILEKPVSSKSMEEVAAELGVLVNNDNIPDAVTTVLAEMPQAAIDYRGG